jgi:hypothetical protein
VTVAFARWIAALAITGALVGCAGGPRLAHDPSAPVNLSGHWVLDAAASDDAPALIRASLPRPKQERRPRYDGWGNEVGSGAEGPEGAPGAGRGSGRSASGGSRSGRGGSDEGDRSATFARESVPAWGRAQPYDYVAYFALPPSRLEIDQQPAKVRLGSGDRYREFVPGDEEPINLTDRYGSRALRAGWIADAFAVATDDGKNLHVVDSLRRAKDGGVERVTELKITGVKSLIIHSKYRLATSSEWTNLGETGPPAPVR